MERALRAAVRRFPLRGEEIAQLAKTNPSFRSLCQDLADAESALGGWAQSTSSKSGLRQSEYEVLVDELAGEIEQTLQRRSAEAAAQPVIAGGERDGSHG